MTFIPSFEDPAEHCLDVVENIMRRGLPALGIPSAVWVEDEPCPAGHWFLDEGAALFRYSIPASDSDPGPSLILGLADKSTRRHQHDARYWDVPLIMECHWGRDFAPDQWRLLKRQLEGVLTVGVQTDAGGVQARAILSRGAVNVYHIKDVECDKVTLVEGAPSLAIRFTLFCSGRRILTDGGALLKSPDGFTLSF